MFANKKIRIGTCFILQRSNRCRTTSMLSYSVLLPHFPFCVRAVIIFRTWARMFHPCLEYFVFFFQFLSSFLCTRVYPKWSMILLTCDSLFKCFFFSIQRSGLWKIWVPEYFDEPARWFVNFYGYITGTGQRSGLWTNIIFVTSTNRWSQQQLTISNYRIFGSKSIIEKPAECFVS